MYAINFLGEGYFKELRMHVVHFVQVLEFWSISSTCTKALMVTCENTWSIQLHQTITGFQDQVCMDIKFSLVTDAHHFWPTFLRKLSSSQNGTIQYLYCIALHIALHCTLHCIAHCTALHIAYCWVQCKYPDVVCPLDNVDFSTTDANCGIIFPMTWN